MSKRTLTVGVACAIVFLCAGIITCSLKEYGASVVSFAVSVTFAILSFDREIEITLKKPEDEEISDP